MMMIMMMITIMIMTICVNDHDHDGDGDNDTDHDNNQKRGLAPEWWEWGWGVWGGWSRLEGDVALQLVLHHEAGQRALLEHPALPPPPPTPPPRCQPPWDQMSSASRLAALSWRACRLATLS